MSLMRACLRVTTVAALRDRTLAESRVYDSDNSPLVDALGDKTAPYIVVYTEDDNRSVEGKDMIGSDRLVSIVIAFAVAGPMTVTKDSTSIVIPPTDAGKELLLDLIEHQITKALVHDPKSAWGALWGDLVMRLGAEVRSRRGASTEGGERWAAREFIIQVEPCADHPPGDPYEDDHPVKRLIAALRAAPQLNMGPAADMIESMLDSGTSPSWRQAQAWLGTTEEAARDLGVGPADGGEEDITTEGIGFDPIVDAEGAAGMIGDAEPDEDAGKKGIQMPEPTYPDSI